MPITVLTAAEIKNLDHMCPYAESMKMGSVISALITASNGSTTYAGPAVTDAMVANFDEKACPNWDAKNGNVEIAGILKDLIDGTAVTDLTTTQVNALNGGSRCPVFESIGTLGTKIQGLIDAQGA